MNTVPVFLLQEDQFFLPTFLWQIHPDNEFFRILKMKQTKKYDFKLERFEKKEKFSVKKNDETNGPTTNKQTNDFIVFLIISKKKTFSKLFNFT